VDETTVYYERRAREYERIYGFAHWQHDLAVLDELVTTSATGRRVLEVACGTGYWTQRLARTAAHVCGVDINGATLSVAQTRTYGPAAVSFVQADVYAALPLAGRSDAGFAGLWLSHVDVTRMRDFLDAFHSALSPGSCVMLFDERETESRVGATARVDAAGNRYEKRRLADGSRFEILKNWYDAAALQKLFSDRGHGFWCRELEQFWVCGYTARS
jgi:demethylmenaquinone methyltransferase/2-methoxy-6-polyprenyl-1,4-benzoquinol methylase